MKLSLSFQGYVVVDTDDICFYNHDGIIACIDSLTPDEIKQKLELGDLNVGLTELLESNQKSSVELFDYDLEEF